MKIVSAALLALCSSSVFAQTISDYPVERPKATLEDRCYFNENPHKFSGISVTPDGSESYVYQSTVFFFNHYGKNPPKDFYKGELKVNDHQGLIYEICVVGNKLPYQYGFEK